MKKLVFITVVAILTLEIGHGQDIVKICDSIVTVNDFDRAGSILKEGGMIIEPTQNLFGGYDPAIKRVASNGTSPTIPMLCTITANSKTDRHIELITVIYKGEAGSVISKLKEIGYEFLYSGTRTEGEFKFNYNVYCKPNSNITCKVSLPSDGSTGAILEFHKEV